MKVIDNIDIETEPDRNFLKIQLERIVQNESNR